MKKSIKTKSKIWILNLEDFWMGYEFPEQIILTESDLEEGVMIWLNSWEKGAYPPSNLSHYGVCVDPSLREISILECIQFYDNDGYLDDPDDIEVIATYKYSEHN
jgi:hypothetical protein